MFHRDVIKTVQKNFKNSAEVSNSLKYFGILVSQNNNDIKIGQNDYIENLTILKRSCVLFNSDKNGWLAAFDLLDIFTQSIKFHYTFHYHVLRVQMFEKCDSSNRQ